MTKMSRTQALLARSSQSTGDGGDGAGRQISTLPEETEPLTQRLTQGTVATGVMGQIIEPTRITVCVRMCVCVCVL